MSSKLKTTIFLILIFLALLGFVYFYEKDRVVKDKDEIVMHDVINIEKNQVTAVAFEFDDKKTVVVKEGDVWNLTEPIKFKARATKIESLIDELNALESETTFESTKLEEYGLDKPDVKVTFTLADGGNKIITIGDLDLQGTLVYLKTSENDSIYLVDTMTETRLRLNDENLRED